MNMASVCRDLTVQKQSEDEQRDLNETLAGLIEARTGELAEVNLRLVAESIDRRRMNARVQKLQSELYHAARFSEAGQMAAALAHELNQPLTAAANSTNAGRRLLATGEPERLGEVREAMAEAAEQMVRAGQIVRRLRDFITRGETEKQIESVTAMVEEIRNAIEAMAGCIRRDLGITTARLNDETIEIAVSDTGIGLPGDGAGRPFQPFVSTKPHGMGLGLSISNSIVEAHGGRLNSEPNPGEGTTFRFTIARAGDAK
jgi:two-component system, LuxR family, sensor kinase FixL